MKEKFVKLWFIINAIALIAIAAGIYFLYQNYQKSVAAYDDALDQGESLTSSTPYPSVKNLKLARAQMSSLEVLRSEIRRDFGKYDHQNVRLPSNFLPFMSKSIKNSKDYFGEKGVEYDAESFFGFKDYTTQAVQKQYQQDICFSLNSVLWFLRMASDEGITEIVNVHRVKHEAEEVRSQPTRRRRNATNNVLKGYEFQIILKGSEPVIQNVLNRILTEKKYFVAVNALKLESSRQLPLKVERIKKLTRSSSLSSSLFGEDEVKEDSVEITKIAGDADLYLALQIQFLKSGN